MFLRAQATPRVTRAECLESKKKTHPFAARNEETNPSESFNQTSEFRGVVTARSGSYRVSPVHKKSEQNCLARQQQFPNQQVSAVQLGVQTSIGVESAAGRINSSQPCDGTAVRQHRKFIL